MSKTSDTEASVGISRPTSLREAGHLVRQACNIQNMIARGKEVLVYQKAPQAAAAE